MKAWAKEIKQNTLLKWNGLFNFKQKIHLSIESGSYILKTAETFDELINSFRLRHEVFYNEFQSLDFDGIDFDKYDAHFDHLIIIHKDSRTVIGTYRVNCLSYSSLSYTESEFNLKSLLDLKGPHLELGRACIHRDHRKGSVLSLLWRGITEYMNLSGASVLFGCSSIKVTETNKAALLYRYFAENNMVSSELTAHPTRKFSMPDFDLWYSFYRDGLTEEQKKEAEMLIPPLLKSYLKHGAKIVGLPALDSDFGCVDFLTVLHKADMTNSLARRFQVVQ